MMANLSVPMSVIQRQQMRNFCFPNGSISILPADSRRTISSHTSYAEYRQIRKEKEELLIAKRTVETILNIDRQKEQEKEQEKEEKKNFR